MPMRITLFSKKALNQKRFVTNEANKPLLIAGKAGKGRVVLNGMITGWASLEKGEYEGKESVPEGAERQLLFNTCRWLGEAEAKEMNLQPGISK